MPSIQPPPTLPSRGHLPLELGQNGKPNLHHSRSAPKQHTHTLALLWETSLFLTFFLSWTALWAAGPMWSSPDVEHVLV